LARTTLLAVLILLPGFARASDVPIKRELHHVKLGCTLGRVRKTFPPTKEWIKVREPNGGLVRIDIDRESARSFSPDVEKMQLGFHWGLLAYLKVIYTKAHTKERPIDKVVTEYAVDYGEPRRDGEMYFWKDGSTVLRVSEAELPAAKGKGVELRTAIEVMNRSVFVRKADQ